MSKVLTLAFLLLGLLGCGSSSGGSADTNPPKSESTITVTTLAIAVPNFPRNELLNFLSGYNQVYTNQLIEFPEPQSNSLVLDYFRSRAPEQSATHLIYIFNGPGIRRGTDSFFGAGITEREANKLLSSDSATRNKVTNLFNETVAYARQLEALGVEVLISPELEDNLSDQNYRYLEQTLVNAGFAPDKIIRNPVTNRVTTPGRYEVHPHSLTELEAMLPALKPGDIVNTDGANWTKFTASDLQTMKHLTEARGALFFVWSNELQGYTADVPYPSYRARLYSFPSLYKDTLEVLFPRSGSIPAEVTPTEKVVTRFLWKPRAEGGGPGFQGKPVILLDPAGVSVKVNGVEFRNTGASNGWSATYRSNGRACNQYAGAVTVEFFDSATGLPIQTVFNRTSEAIENPCTRKQW